MSVDIENGGLVLFFDSQTRVRDAYYISPIGWNSLAIKLFLRGEHSTAFVPIYPTNGDTSATVKIWKIHYPPDIKKDDKSLATDPPGETEKQRKKPPPCNRMPLVLLAHTDATRRRDNAEQELKLATAQPAQKGANGA